MSRNEEPAPRGLFSRGIFCYNRRRKMSGNAAKPVDELIESIAERAVRRQEGACALARPVRITRSGDRTEIDVYLNVRFGAVITDVAWSVQERIKDTVERVLGTGVSAVNIHISGVKLTERKK